MDLGIVNITVPFCDNKVGEELIRMSNMKELKIPFWLKINLTIKEAAAYSGIGINKIDNLLKQPQCNFVLYVGRKKMVKRKEFEQFLSKSLEI